MQRCSTSWQTQHLMLSVGSCHLHRFPHSPVPVSPQHPGMQEALVIKVEVQRQQAGSEADAFASRAQLQTQHTAQCLCCLVQQTDTKTYNG